MVESSTFTIADPAMVSPRIIALREALGMSKAEFADAIEMDRSSWTKIEKADKPILPHTAYKIWQRWAVDMNYIYLGRLDGLPEHLSKKVTAHLTSEKL